MCMYLQIEVSSACKELVRGMLRTDPDKRMSLQEIISNPWFQHDLPSGAMAMNDFYSNCTPLPQEVSLPPADACVCSCSCAAPTFGMPHSLLKVVSLHLKRPW